jgi:gliding motility-associated-like protein
LNGAGFSSAKDGNAMFGAGIILGPGSTNIGESFGVKLLEKLKENVVYCYSFWVKLADSSNYTGYDANIGFYDNENAYYNDPNTNFHYVKNNNKTLFNTLEWVEIAGSFLANGNESYLIVGNFNSPDTTFATPTGMTTSMTGAYVYFDLISIYNCDSTFLPEAPNVITANGDGFNDFWTLNDYNKAVGTIEIYNRWGNLVYKRKESEPIIWDPANISSGVYFYIIQSKNDITKQKRGTITVLGGP